MLELPWHEVSTTTPERVAPLRTPRLDSQRATRYGVVVLTS